jgi:F-type H+-transporting ATPase subunit b
VIVPHLITTFAEAASHAAQEPQGIAALGIDPWALLAQGITFLLLVFLLKKFAFTKIVEILEERRKAVDESLDKAEALSKKNEDAEKRVNTLLHDARKEAEDIINKSHEEAGSIVQEAEDTAGTKAEKIIADGKLQIQNEVVKARLALKEETLDLVSRATSVVLDEAVDAKKHEALVKKALSETK